MAPHQVKPSLPRHLRIALSKLWKDTSIVNKPTDKNLYLIIMNKKWYLKEGYRQLSDEFRACILYFLSKIHKFTLVGRPICSYNDYVFEYASIWLHHEFHHILIKQKNYLVDSLTILREIFELEVPTESILFTFNVESLYPSILTVLRLHALECMVNKGFFP